MAETQVATKSPAKQRPAAAKPKKTDKAVQAQADLVQAKAEHALYTPSFGTKNENTASRSNGLWAPSVQTKLKVGKPGDSFEQEADAVADRVVQARYQQSPDSEKSPPSLQTKAEEEPELQAQIAEEPEVQTKPDEEPDVQAMAEEGPQVQAQTEEEPDVQTQAEDEPDVQAKEDEPEVQTKIEEEPEVQAKAEEEPEVQAMEEEAELQTKTEEEPQVQVKDGEGQTTDSFENQLNASSNGGSPLPQSTVNQVSPHLGADLSSVRVHTDGNAAQMNQQLGSQAFTHQNHVYFNEGKYNPGSTSGDHLIAHELTHTVQQGAAVKTNSEEEPEEDIQTKAESPELQKQIGDAPTDGNAAPPPAPAANPDSGSDAGGGEAPPPTPPAPPADSGNTGGAGNTGSPPPADAPQNAAAEPAKPQEGDLNKDNPITQREEVKAEEGQQVEKLGLAGTSEESMAAFTTAGASAIAATLPGLGDAMSQKLGAEKQKEAAEAPVLTAGTTGVQDPKAKPANGPGAAKNADLNDGATEGEPAAPKLEPHQEGRPLPKYRKDEKLDKGKPQEAESGGFFSWLFDKFKDVMGGVSTRDGGMNTSAGTRPKIDTTGQANPDRTANQTKEGKDQVNQQKDKAAEEIGKNPGQENIQPQFFEEPNTIQLNTELSAPVLSEQDQNMAEFVSVSLPEEVRAQADLDLAPTMEKSLQQPREQTQQAALKRDTDKQAAINDSKAQVEQLNKEAEQQQQQVVAENRQAVADEQKRGIDEANTQMNAFSTEADKEKDKANKAAKERIKQDQDGADKKLKQAEIDAEKERKKGEAKAKAEKDKAKKDSGEKSWWGKFKDAVSSAVSWLTEKIGQIFKAIREAVTALIDLAKEAALALIEAGRKWIVEKLDQFGSWLKEKANKYLAAFPALRDKVNGFIDKTVNTAKAAVNKIADGLKKGVTALADALSKGINAVLNAFETALTAAVQFAGALLKGDFTEALKIAFLATCKIAGIDPNPVLNFINKAGETMGMIFKDPAAFFGNVASGVKMGMDQFVVNIKKHLISGLIGWLTGAMSDVPIQMPEKFDLKGIFSLVMQILGLTYDRIRAKVVKRIGPKGEQVVSGMEQGFQFVKDLVTKGPIVLYERIQDKFNEIKEMAMEKIRNLITIEVVKAGIKWLIGLLNPASAIVKAVLMLFDFVMFLVERKDQIIGFVTAIFDTVGPLARGQVKSAANAVEGAMGKGVPVILGLLANLAGLGGIGKQVSKVIKTIQKPVDKVVDPIIGWLVKQGKKLWKKGKGAYKKGKKKIKDLAKKGLDGFFRILRLKKKFKMGKVNHAVYFKGKGKKVQIIMNSTPRPLFEYIGKIRTRIDTAPLPPGVVKSVVEPHLISAETNRNALELKMGRYKENDDYTTKYFNDKNGVDISNLLTDISKSLSHIPNSLLEAGVAGNIVRPKTDIEYAPGLHPVSFQKGDDTVASQEGNWVKAKLSSVPDGINTGSGATKFSPYYSAINDRRGSDVVPGHLLNHQLYGTGSKLKNLAPITRSANGAMAGNHEKKAKKHVLQDNKVAFYNITIDWTSAINRPKHTEIDKHMPYKVTSTLSLRKFNEKSIESLSDPQQIEKEQKDYKNWIEEQPGGDFSYDIKWDSAPPKKGAKKWERMVVFLINGPKTAQQISANIGSNLESVNAFSTHSTYRKYFAPSIPPGLALMPNVSSNGMRNATPKKIIMAFEALAAENPGQTEFTKDRLTAKYNAMTGRNLAAASDKSALSRLRGVKITEGETQYHLSTLGKEHAETIQESQSGES